MTWWIFLRVDPGGGVRIDPETSPVPPNSGVPNIFGSMCKPQIRPPSALKRGFKVSDAPGVHPEGGKGATMGLKPAHELKELLC